MCYISSVLALLCHREKQLRPQRNARSRSQAAAADLEGVIVASQAASPKEVTESPCAHCYYSLSLFTYY